MSTRLFDGPLPEHIVENLQRGVAPHEKRVVANLAKVSRIVNTENMTIRTYDDFKQDWKYTHSLYAKVGEHNCFLCGKQHIRELCQVHDEVQGKTITVGNECVWKHVEIMTDAAEGLTGDAKRDFLKDAMAKAKAKFMREKFAAGGHLTTDWEEYRDYATGAREGWPVFGKENRTYAKRADRMINERGYLTGKTEEWFMTKRRDFRADVFRWKEDAKKVHAERLHLNAEAARRRRERDTDATNFRLNAEQGVDDGRVSPALAKGIASVEQGIRRYGLHGLKWSLHDTYEAIMAGLLGKPTVDEPIEVFHAHYDDLSEWEHSFLHSISEKRTSLGLPLTPKQQKVFDKIKKKVAA
jgi:hypothetical protein